MKNTKKKETEAVKSTAKAKVTKELTFEEKVLKELASIKRKLASVATDVAVAENLAVRTREAIDPLSSLIFACKDSLSWQSVFLRWIILDRLGMADRGEYRFIPSKEEREKYDLVPNNTSKYSQNYVKWCEDKFSKELEKEKE